MKKKKYLIVTTSDHTDLYVKECKDYVIVLVQTLCVIISYDKYRNIVAKSNATSSITKKQFLNQLKKSL